ncbi:MULTISPECIES: CrpP-related protein [Rhizobium]|uniref:Uncharacterized protein n=1 Tax=Rhizobium favelukesii TaxID=348824 RepID=W6RPD3_9HYPH|nr:MULTISPECIES: CrpP-related protein [Rhizobium]MCS0463546.1 hypothetical protein [Rhizobium favelukesii]UFS80233.1 hypothetical protein LPB79_02910 [Rhizobium sp. T136]CDM62020.1 hypothetical protein LPU83_pLPU83d_0649 [Rhizobium favelukesii]
MIWRRARILGLKVHENPYLKPERLPKEDEVALGDWVARHDAWKFGWEAENASREGSISKYFPSKFNRPLGRLVPKSYLRRFLSE